MKQIVRLSLTLAVVVSVSGCADLVRRNYKPTKGGTVRYSRSMIMAEKYRSAAVDKMRDFCSPRGYEILSEDDQEVFTGNSSSRSTTQNNVVTTDTSSSKSAYTFIHFECKRK